MSAQETEPTMFNFAGYREYCDSVTIGSRRTGLLEEDLALQAMLDPSTIALATSSGVFPAIVPLKYMSGYDTGRCRSIAEGYAGDEDVSLYYADFPDEVNPQSDSSAVLERRLAELANTGPIYVFTDDPEDRQANAAFLLDLSGRTDLEIVEVPLIDEEATPGNRQVSISLYGTTVPEGLSGKHKGSLKAIIGEFKKAVDSGEYEERPRDGVTFIAGEDIDPNLLDQLWRLYQDRFQWLGEKHPISMEDSFEDFKKELTSPHTISSIYFEGGEPACFGYFTDNVDDYYWLSKKFFDSNERLRKTDSEGILFFVGIVAKIEGLGHYSQPVMQLLAKMIKRADINMRILFENTNRSEAYIPDLVKKYADAEDGITIEQPRVLDRHYYRLFKISTNG